MAVPYQLKRTTVAGRTPTTSDILSGQIGVNLTDQKAFCSNGTGIFEVGANLSSLQVANVISYGNAADISSITFTTSGTSLQTIDTVNTAIYRSASYIITVKDNNANAYQTSMINMLYDGSTSSICEFGLIYSNTNIAIFSGTANSTSMSLQVTPTSTATKCQIHKTLVHV